MIMSHTFAQPLSRISVLRHLGGRSHVTIGDAINQGIGVGSFAFRCTSSASMGVSDSDSDYGDAVMSGYGRSSRKRSRRNFKQRIVTSSEDGDGRDIAGLAEDDACEEERGGSGVMNTPPYESFLNGVDLSNWSDRDNHGFDSSAAAMFARNKSDSLGEEGVPSGQLEESRSPGVRNNGLLEEFPCYEGGLDVSHSRKGVKRLKLGQMFSFLRDGQPGDDGDRDSSSSTSSVDGERDLAVPGDARSVEVEATNAAADAVLWSDSAVQAVYGSKDDNDRRLAMMTSAMKSSATVLGETKSEAINSFMKLWGILHLVGSKRWRGKDYDEMVRLMSLSVANAKFLGDNVWRRAVLVSGDDGNDDVACYEMKKGPFIAPSRRTIERLLPSLLGFVTVHLAYYLVPINTKKVGGFKIVKETMKAKASVKAKLLLQKNKVSKNSTMEGEAADAPVDATGSGSVPGGRSVPIEVRGSDSGGVVAVTSLESLIKFDMLTPGIYRSIVKEAAKEETDPFSIYQIPAVAARRVQHNFTKRIDALVPLDEMWETPSPVSGHFEEEYAVMEDKVKRSSAGVNDCVCIITENAFDASDDVLFHECAELPLISSDNENGSISPGSAFVFNAAAAETRSDSTTFEGRIVAVWMVDGSGTWNQVNETCVDICDRQEVVIAGLRACENVKVLQSNFRREYRSLSSFATDDEVHLMSLLSFASYGRKGDGVNRCGNLPTGRSNHSKPTLPFSPLKAGDTVSLIRHGRVCPSSCACDKFRAGVPSDTIYAVVVNRFWNDPSVVSTFVYVVENIIVAIDAIRTASARSASDTENDNCPYGTSVDDEVCRSKVFKTPTSLRGPRGRTKLFMRRSCKVVVINEISTNGNSLEFDRHGYLEPHVRAECKAALPTIGRLGEKWGGLRYVMYRIVLYWDGFTQGTTRGSSVEGVYAQLLNLSPEERRSASAIRVLSVGPPGSDVRDLCVIVLGEVFGLMVRGVRCWTADGEEVVVFLDLVGGLADTPALTQVLDTQGHISSTPCTLCRYKLPSEAGKGLRKGGKKGAAAKARVSHRYASQHTDSGLQVSRRTAVNHQAVRDACPPDEELLAIGMQVVKRIGAQASSVSPSDANISGDVEDDDAEPAEEDCMSSGPETLPFHLFRQRYEAARDNDELPKNEDGTCLYPGTFCPYTALFPGVEHLVVGLFKGAMKFALRLMTDEDRVNVNTYLTNYMQACGLPVQSQFVNPDSSVGLNTMSMSQSYCVSLFAERSLTAVAKNPERKTRPTLVGKQKDLAIPTAIHLVKLISDLISLTWVQEGKIWFKYGSAYVPFMQKKIRSYVSAVASACKDGTTRASGHLSSVPDDDSDAVAISAASYGNGRRRGANSRKVENGQPFDPSEIARSTVDTPNVHKLTELGATVLGNVGHLAKIAELAFEVRHGPTKSSMGRSSGIDTQIAAMSAAAFTDWSGRIAMTYEGALNHDKGSLLAMVRFLFGEEEYLFCIRNGLSCEMELKVRNVIGPNEFNPTFLKKHGVKLVGGGQRPGSLGEGAKVWAADVSYSVLRRDTAKIRAVVPQKVVEEVEELWDNAVRSSDQRNVIQGTAENTTNRHSLVWVGSLRRQLLSSLPTTRRVPHRGGQDNFLRTIVVGSVIRVAENCLERLSSTWKIPFVELRPERQECSPTFGKDFTFWCVIGMFQIGSTVKPAMGLNRQPPVIGMVCHGLQDKSVGMLIAPCCYSNGDGVRPTLGTMDYSRSLQVSSNSLNCVSDSEERIFGALVLNAHVYDESVVPVAVMSQCESVEEGGCCGVAAEGPTNGISSRVVKHGPRCGVLAGGKFFIRDSFSGYPPRSA